MLAGEPFSDRSRSVSPVIGAFVRTYNDGVDERRRQDLKAVSAAVVGTAAGRAVDRERIALCLAFARAHNGLLCRGRGALAMATPEAAGAAAAQAVLRQGPTEGGHEEALAFVQALIAADGAGDAPRWWRRRRRLTARAPTAAVAAVEAEHEAAAVV